jgi:hypothetical protein
MLNMGNIQKLKCAYMYSLCMALSVRYISLTTDLEMWYTTVSLEFVTFAARSLAGGTGRTY